MNVNILKGIALSASMVLSIKLFCEINLVVSFFVFIMVIDFKNYSLDPRFVENNF